MKKAESKDIEVLPQKPNIANSSIKPLQNRTAHMYLGPNLPGGRLQTGSVYKNNLPKYLNSFFEKMPELRELFVEVKEVPKLKKELSIKGTEADRLYRSLLVSIKEVVW